MAGCTVPSAQNQRMNWNGPFGDAFISSTQLRSVAESGRLDWDFGFGAALAGNTIPKKRQMTMLVDRRFGMAQKLARSRRFACGPPVR